MTLAQISRIAILLVSIISSSSVFAEVQIGGPVAVSSAIPAWRQNFDARIQKFKAQGKVPRLGLTECRPTEELPQVFLCLSPTQREMNALFLRASYFVEGLDRRENKNKVISPMDPGYRDNMNRVGGHDLKGEDLLRFYEAVSLACRDSGRRPESCLSERESEIFEIFILPRAKASPQFVLISIASKSAMGWREVVSHEILHAQYFSNPVYRAIVDEYFETEVSFAEKIMIRHHLSGTYDTSDELLMRNEFQAYMLMAGAETSLLAGFVSDHRGALMARLANVGIDPIQIR